MVIVAMGMVIVAVWVGGERGGESFRTGKLINFDLSRENYIL